jgi:hypothetical protein
VIVVACHVCDLPVYLNLVTAQVEAGEVRVDGFTEALLAHDAQHAPAA